MTEEGLRHVINIYLVHFFLIWDSVVISKW